MNPFHRTKQLLSHSRSVHFSNYLVTDIIFDHQRLHTFVKVAINFVLDWHLTVYNPADSL